VLDDGVVRAAEGTPFVDLRPTGPDVGPVDEVPLLAPVRPRTVLCVGRNYRSHAEEFGNPVPEEPLLFLKPPAAVVGPGADVVYPAFSQRVDPEAELVLVIGRTARNVAAADAWDVIGGYTCGNDVTARDLQRSDPQWTRAKGFDSFCPLGPWIVTDLDVRDLEVRCEVGRDPEAMELRQLGRTKDMIFDVPTLVSYVSHVMTLLPGDVILTGTPAGVGPLESGETVSVSIQGIGELANPVVSLE